MDVHIALRDGSTARVRPVEPSDEPALREFLAGLSHDSRWLRFFSLGVDLDRAAARAAAPGGYGLIVTSSDRVVAHAVYEIERPGRAEVAFAVADGMQGRGLATVLLAHLAQEASARGIGEFMATVLPENRRMISVFRESGFPVSVHASADGIEVEFPTELGEAARARFEDRDRVAAVAAVERVLRPRSVAVIGASRRPDSFGGATFRHALAAGFRGELYPVNPNVDFVGSRRALASVSEGSAELAIIAVPASLVAGVARECAAAGVAALVVITAGFSAAQLAELLDVCRAGGMRLLGPNCMGIVNTDPAVSLSATFARADVPAGNVGFASQSGAFGAAAIDGAVRRGIGLSAFVSFGDKADLSGNDVLQYWEQDRATAVVALYLESFGNPRKFGRVARRVARAKPVLAIKAGRLSARAREAESDTGALLASVDTAVDALFASAGVIRCDGLDDLLDAAAVLAEQPLPAGSRVAIVANARGPEVVCADACIDAGLDVVAFERHVADARFAEAGLAGAPVPATSSPPQAAPHGFLSAVQRAAAGADAVIAIFVEHIAGGAEDAAAALAAASLDVPLLAVFMTPGPVPGVLREAKVPAYTAPEAAARALGRAAAYSRWKATTPAEPEKLEGVDADAAAAILSGALAAGGGWLDPADAKALLRAYEIPTDEAGPGVELLVGVLADERLGPVVACAAGGEAVQEIADVQVRLAPLARAEATEMVGALRTSALLERERADVDAVVDVILRIAALADAHPAIAELDCNPVIASPGGAVVTGARVRVAAPAARPPFPALNA
jgi:acetate---CoA ligase (ADP-forming)